MLKVIILLILTVESIYSVCPKSEETDPCTCHETPKGKEIVCNTDIQFNLKRIFRFIGDDPNPQSFRKFTLSGPGFVEIVDDLFENVFFEEIDIVNAINLTKISTTAFGATNSKVKSLRVKNTKIDEISETHNFYSAFSSLSILENLTISHNQISRIPNNAFKHINGDLSQLKHIDLSSNRITTIGEFAFFELGSLVMLNLSHNAINKLQTTSLKFNEPKTPHERPPGVVDLSFNKLGSANISLNALEGFYRATTLNITGNNITYLDKDAFMTFFDSNSTNKLIYSNTDCQDCKSAWLFDEKRYIDEVAQLTCSNGNKFKNNLNFVNCP